MKTTDASMGASKPARDDASHEGGDDGRVVLFSLAGDTYGLPLGDVREVSEYAAAKPVPRTPPACLGILNVRGDIVTVVDLRILWGLPERDAGAPVPALLLVDVDGWIVACVADAIEGVCRLAEGTVEPLPRIPSSIPGGTFRGLFHARDRAVVLLDLPTTIRASGLADLAKAA